MRWFWSLTVVLGLSTMFRPVTFAEDAGFLRGDANVDGMVSLADLHFLTQVIYLGAHPSTCMNAGDVNDDGCVQFDDLRYLYRFFRAGSHIPPPYPDVGPDPTRNDCSGPSFAEATCPSNVQGGPIPDPAARLIVLDAVASGVDSTVDITVLASCSRSIAGYRGILLGTGLIANYAGRGDPISGNAIPEDLTGSGFNDAVLGGLSIIRATSETFEFGFSRAPPWSTDWIPAGEEFPVMRFTVCLAEGVLAGEYPLHLLSGELVDAESGHAIVPVLEDGILTVEGDINPGCEPPAHVECGRPTANLADLNVEIRIPHVVAAPGMALSIPVTIRSSADLRKYGLCIHFDAGVFDSMGSSVRFLYEKPDGTPYSRATWQAFPSCIPGGEGLTAEAWFSYTDDCNNLPADRDVEACRLGLQVFPDAAPGTYELHLQAAFFLVYDRRLPQDRPEGVRIIPGLVTILGETADFKRGDANSDGRMDISDAITILGALFLGSPDSPCPDGADANDDGRMDLSDPVYLLGSLFQGGRDPPLPGHRTCGADPSEDTLGPCFYDPSSCR